MNRFGLGAVFSRGRMLMAVTLLVAAGVAILQLGSARPGAGDRSASVHPVLASYLSESASEPVHFRAAYGQLPLSFEANQGQSDARVQFLARGRAYGLFLTKQEAVLVLQHAEPGANRSILQSSVVRMKLEDANPSPEVVGTEQLPGKSNYLIGNDPSRWHRNVPQFARVRYRDAYPGVDLVYYGRQGRLEYDFEVRPGADPALVSLRFETSAKPGTQNLRLDAEGDLLLATEGGEVRFEAPHVYQNIGNERRTVAGHFVLRGDDRVGFALGAYDRSRILVIDPVLAYSTYLGGSGAESCSAITGAQFTPGCPAIAVDSALNAYVAGSTTSTNFPVPSGGTAPTLKGVANVFITKLNSLGSALLFTTYLGGSGTDTTAGIGVDSGFDVVVAGTTNSANFPTTPGAYQTTPASANNHVFVTRLDPTGSSLLYSTYLSGNGIDLATGVALDVQGKIYVTGTTTSTNTPSGSVVFPATVGAFQPASLATNQFFMSKIDPTLTGTSSVPYSTYFGGGDPANGVALGGGIAVDSNSNAYITGGTNFLHVGAAATDFPILNAVQGCLDTPEATAPTTAPTCSSLAATDAFVAKINPEAASGAQLQYSTYVGGTGNDVGYGIAVDSGGTAYITGSTTSTDFVLPTGTVPFQSGNGGGTDAFVAKISSFTLPTTTTTTATPVSLLYFSYLGGSGNDTGLAIALDPLQDARVVGWTDSSNFPTQTPVQAASGGLRDAFIANLSTTSDVACTPSATVHCPGFSSYFGGNGTDMATSIALDLQNANYIAGETTSTNFPLLNALQGTLDGPSDAFVTKLSPLVSLAMTASASPSPVGVGNQVTFTYAINDLGDPTSGITFTDNYSASSPNATFVSATASPGSCGTAVSGGSVQCNLGTLNTTVSGVTGATVSVILTPTAATLSSTQATPPIPPPLGNSATLTVSGSSFQTSAAATATINDFGMGVAPASATVTAGAPASYTITLTPTGAIPGNVTLAVGSGAPTGVTSSFSTSPIPSLANGPVSSVLTVNTTARVTTTVRLWHAGGPLYAVWLPVSGLAFLGVGVGGVMSRKRRLLLGLMLGGFLTLLLFQAGCGTSAPTTTTTGTPAGTYTLTVNATSGTATRTTTVQLVVQ